MRRVLSALMLVVGLAVAAGPLYGQGSWWNRAWRCRRVVEAVPPKVSIYPGSEAAYFELYGQGHLKPDGSDIRVVAQGRLLRHKVLYVSPTGIARILFEVLPGVNTYEIYYGNPDAPAPTDDWEPRRGLILRTLRYNGGRYNNWAQAQETLRRAGPVMGAGPVDRVFHGHNPFGPSRRFISIYDGWLYCPVAGTYSFATTSGNASFLFINGRRVVDWPGHHGPVPDARHHREVVLPRGLARFRYVAVFVAGRPTAVAAWRLPGSQRYEVIPKSAFPPLVVASGRSLEIQGQRVAPDFRVEFAGEATLTPEGDRFLVKVRFVNTSSALAKRNYRPLWDFGDGTTSRELSPTHIYLAPGTYPVTLTLIGSGRYRATQPIEVVQDWNAQVARRIDDRADYYDQIRQYDLTKLSGEALANLVDYYLALEKPAEALRAGEVLLSPAPQGAARRGTPDAVLLRSAHRLEEVLLPPGYPPGRQREPQRALRLYGAVEAQASGARAKAEAALAQGRILFEELRDLEGAQAAYRRVLTEYRRPVDSLEARGAYIGLGRIERWRGNLTAAREWFRKAQGIAVGEGSAERLLVRRSAWARNVEDALRRDDPEVLSSAWRDLTTWAWHYPEDLLEGHHTVLLGRLLLKQKAPQRAAEELEALLRVNPESQYADQALWSLADCYLALGDRRKALEALDRIARDYPTSGLVPRLQARRQEVESARIR